MKAKYGGRCACCGEPFAVGTEIDYDGATKRAFLPGHEIEASPEEIEEMKALADKLGFQ